MLRSCWAENVYTFKKFSFDLKLMYEIYLYSTIAHTITSLKFIMIKL